MDTSSLKRTKDVGVNLDNRLHFSKIIEANNHDEAIRILLEGRADVAAVSSVNLQENIARNPEYAQRIRILHESSLFQALHWSSHQYCRRKLRIRSKN